MVRACACHRVRATVCAAFLNDHIVRERARAYLLLFMCTLPIRRVSQHDTTYQFHDVCQIGTVHLERRHVAGGLMVGVVVVIIVGVELWLW